MDKKILAVDLCYSLNTIILLYETNFEAQILPSVCSLINLIEENVKIANRLVFFNVHCYNL